MSTAWVDTCDAVLAIAAQVFLPDHSTWIAGRDSGMLQFCKLYCVARQPPIVKCKLRLPPLVLCSRPFCISPAACHSSHHRHVCTVSQSQTHRSAARSRVRMLQNKASEAPGLELCTCRMAKTLATPSADSILTSTSWPGLTVTACASSLSTLKQMPLASLLPLSSTLHRSA